ncbi:MAG: nucleoside hydrolase [Bacteroidota bacterium]|nr:nucleoside hydrolase [Bacteroidota bacterium]
MLAGKADAATVQRPKLPTNIIFETDMGNDVDDAMALDLLYKNMDSKKVNVLAVMSNKDNQYSTEFIDVMNTWYGYPDIKIGKVVKGLDPVKNDVPYVEKICQIKDANGNPYFKRTKDETSIPEATKLYRMILSKQPDHSVVIISVGYSTNIARLLATQPDQYSRLNGKDLVAKKVRLLSVMGGSFGKDAIAEFNIRSDSKAAKTVFTNWPTKIVVTPFEAGNAVEYPGKSMVNDFGWCMGKHPMVEAYKAYLPMPYDRPTWDVIATLFVTNPSDKFFTLSKWGTISIDGNNHTVFTGKDGGRHAYLTISPEQAVLIRDYFVNVLTRKPANK